jgi:type IV secretory pathway ATPase VirB11/archaellum biosynthesis ATPase
MATFSTTSDTKEIAMNTKENTTVVGPVVSEKTSMVSDVLKMLPGRLVVVEDCPALSAGLMPIKK